MSVEDNYTRKKKADPLKGLLKADVQNGFVAKDFDDIVVDMNAMLDTELVSQAKS